MPNYHAIPIQTPDEEIGRKIGRWERLAPTACFWISALTYLICRAMAEIQGSYLGDIPWPFMSDTGRDRPAQYVFISGLAVGGLCYVYSFRSVYLRMLAWLREAKAAGVEIPAGLSYFAHTGLVFSLLAFPCLLGLTVFDTSRHPEVHQAFADTFFWCGTMGTSSYTVFFWRLSEAFPVNQLLALSFRLKASLLALWVVAFAVYLPVGIALACPARLLTMHECLVEKGLPYRYCYENVDPQDSSNTILWTYKDCPHLYTMRAVAQTMCIFSMLMYALTFNVDLHPDLRTLTGDCDGERVLVL
ncbi:unnamed protein product [Discosporangium mesarthrocarpum]